MSVVTTLWELAGPGRYPIVVVAVALPMAILLLGSLTAARVRVPAALWWLVPMTAVTLGAVGGSVGSIETAPWFEQAEAGGLPAEAMQVEAASLAARALGWVVAAGSCALLALTCAIANVARPVAPRNQWVHALASVLVAVPSIAGAALFSWQLGAPLATLGSLLLTTTVVSIALAVSATRGSTEPQSSARLSAGRVLVLSLAIGATLCLGMFWHDALLALGWATESDPVALTRATSGTSIPSAVGFTLAGAVAGLPALATRADPGVFRSTASSLLTIGLLVIPSVALITQAPTDGVREAARGGAISRIPAPLFELLPRAVDPVLEETPADPPDGSCLVTEASVGFTGEPLFALLPPAEHVAASVGDPNEVHELDRTPGCPQQRAPLDGPLAASEVPVIALDARRAAVALSGQAWFRQAGSLRVLVQPDPLQAEAWSAVARRRLATTVPLHWEHPPRVEPPDDHTPGEWNEQLAATLPVTLLEGPYPVLIAGGLRSRLGSGASGVDTLRLVLDSQPPDRRDLVLVPRKEWTVQDLLTTCLAVRDVPGARCVIRPETPTAWAIRTRLPLPW